MTEVAAKRERAAKAALIKHYLGNGRIPWSQGYLLYREQFILETLMNTDAMSCFRHHEPLPAGYGYALDERCVEYPWLFAQIDERPACILDAGSALNHRFLLNLSIWKNKKLHIMTLAPEKNCYWENGISYFYEDLRCIPIIDDFYDIVMCISTLEHVGFDNRQFTGKKGLEANHIGDFIVAVREMRRVLKPAGYLLLTVPFGRYRNISTQQIFDGELLGRTINSFDPKEIEQTFFSYAGGGWQFACIDECENCHYVDWIMLPDSDRPTKFPVQPDGAAAARAVACVKLKK